MKEFFNKILAALFPSIHRKRQIEKIVQSYEIKWIPIPLCDKCRKFEQKLCFSCKAAGWKETGPLKYRQDLVGTGGSGGSHDERS